MAEATKNLHVEVKLNPKFPKSSIQSKIGEIEELIKSNSTNARNWKPLPLTGEAELTELFEKLVIGTCELKDGEQLVLDDFSIDPSTNLHVYKLHKDGPLSQNIGDDADDESIIGSQLWQLPCVEFDSIWENLIYDSNLKNEVMSYVTALVRLSEKHVNTKIINVNRLILLTGPPGTGKTSLCKGLAQHLSIRMNDRYSRSVMMEINSHSLFSKWFSESGKLVQKMFDQIDELAEESKCMVFVLIDEVESLGMCRESSSSRSEPSDAIRAVNALLTQIDRIRRRENVLILCTSNLESTLDRALVDRADIVRNVGQPSDFARYAMLKACVVELIRIGVVEDEEVHLQDILDVESARNDYTDQLLSIAQEARGLSGRAISMLPTLVYSKSYAKTISMENCMTLFREAVQERLSRNSA
ncbi:CBN-PCH-2 protein [Caenorhabditis brenneri]|uniref:CBN-PCH-2 protein n=1 Tax=Caenorhabditis brenneri TaxID=135651 RepID=G0P010_CAEBE|nr:CBN-PCH-2 protein [Caenorhabditis brenneri]